MRLHMNFNFYCNDVALRCSICTLKMMKIGFYHGCTYPSQPISISLIISSKWVLRARRAQATAHIMQLNFESGAQLATVHIAFMILVIILAILLVYFYAVTNAASNLVGYVIDANVFNELEKHTESKSKKQTKKNATFITFVNR